MMKQLQYSIEDSAIAEILGVQNFTNQYSAILEIVKNAYDAFAKNLSIYIDEKDTIRFEDDGCGMTEENILKNWMHVGKSLKSNIYRDNNDGSIRIIAGSKGVGRFALARLGRVVSVISKSKGNEGIEWITDWETSQLRSISKSSSFLQGTHIIISELRDTWGRYQVIKLLGFLNRTYNDTQMKIIIHFKGETFLVRRVFEEIRLGVNCTSLIELFYNSKNKSLEYKFLSDEFKKEVQSIIGNEINIEEKKGKVDIEKELSKNIQEITGISYILKEIGDFKSILYFSINDVKTSDSNKFLYKHMKLENRLKEGVILYRNAFSLSSYEGSKDWLKLNERSRKSPAAATHPTGNWRVRSTQLSGQVLIDKKENTVLEDLSNRQGIGENIYYEIFIEIIDVGLKKFEKYRQSIIRKIATYTDAIDKVDDIPSDHDIKNIAKKILKIDKGTLDDIATYSKSLLNYVKFNSEQKEKFRKYKENYIYDVRILNVLATIGLKSTSMAHDIDADRNFYDDFTNCIKDGLENLNMWDQIVGKEYKDEDEFFNIPLLLDRIQKNNKKIMSFIDTILNQNKKSQFVPRLYNIYNLLNDIIKQWKKDYAWIKINFNIDLDIEFKTSYDILQVILDNLILNSIQNNVRSNKEFDINIEGEIDAGSLKIVYSDTGVGLAEKYMQDPYRILEPHETTREDGHGLGMWIVHNTILKTNGEIIRIKGNDGFLFEFKISEL